MKKPNEFSTIFTKYVYQFDKMKYFMNKKDKKNSCILCDILNHTQDSLLICKSEYISTCVNLYPYNSGHIMLFPNRHVENFLDLNDNENFHLFILTKFFIKGLKILYNPSGFNIGFNIGENSGASIKHIHEHIVPRFENELGMIDIIGGSKVIVESPKITCDKLKNYTIENSTKLPFNLE